MTDKTGRCLCGAVTFTAVDMADHFSCCHCKTCQRWAGSAFKGVSVATKNLTLTGEAHLGIFNSSSFAERAHCQKCGSAIWYRLTAGPYVGNTSIALGLLDETDGLTLKHEYFVDYKNSTNVVPKDRIQLTEADVVALIADFAS